jgi:hypothetical protein
LFECNPDSFDVVGSYKYVCIVYVFDDESSVAGCLVQDEEDLLNGWVAGDVGNQVIARCINEGELIPV